MVRCRIFTCGSLRRNNVDGVTCRLGSSVRSSLGGGVMYQRSWAMRIVGCRSDVKCIIPRSKWFWAVVNSAVWCRTVWDTIRGGMEIRLAADQ